MSIVTPSFSLGIEEEYLLVDSRTLELTAAPDALMTACANRLKEQVSPEFLQCQIEVGTGICATVADARADLGNLRRTVAQEAAEFGLAPLATSTHPIANWADQKFTDKERYRTLEKDLAGVARRMLICGMHVHVGIDDDELRNDLMSQVSYFLPHLLALSTSSPYWDGQDTGLCSYRLAVFDNMPRTGLPPTFESFAEYDRSVQAIINSGAIQDSSKIWWDLRPSARFPTLESRICDVCPRLEDALTITALTQSLMRMLFELRRQNMRWRRYDRFLIAENRWRAQRYGTSRGLIDFGANEVVPFPKLIDELMGLLRPHAQALGCLAEVERAPQILEQGSSADRQRAVYSRALADGATPREALESVIRASLAEFHEGL